MVDVGFGETLGVSNGQILPRFKGSLQHRLVGGSVGAR